jgi:hypothetical protein
MPKSEIKKDLRRALKNNSKQTQIRPKVEFD